MFYQDNLTLPALYEDAEPLQFTVEGLDPQNCRIEVSMSYGSRYDVKYTPSEKAQ